LKVDALKTGLIGTVILALCCFTPILVVTVSAIGLGVITGYLDYILIPSLLFFIALTIYALIKKNKGCCEINNNE